MTKKTKQKKEKEEMRCWLTARTIPLFACLFFFFFFFFCYYFFYFILNNNLVVLFLSVFFWLHLTCFILKQVTNYKYSYYIINEMNKLYSQSNYDRNTLMRCVNIRSYFSSVWNNAGNYIWKKCLLSDYFLSHCLNF